MMVGSYTTLPPSVAATIPRRTLLRQSWIKESPPPPSPSLSPSLAASAQEIPMFPGSTPVDTQEIPSPDPSPDPSPELSRPFDRPRSSSTREAHRRPASVVLTTYISTAPREDEFRGMSGQVSRAKAFFESAPLKGETKGEGESETPPPDDTLVTYSVRNPLREAPKPRILKRYRNTLSAFPHWEDFAGDSSRPPSESPSTAGEVALAEGVRIKRTRPVAGRRRHGTIVGLLAADARSSGASSASCGRASGGDEGSGGAGRGAGSMGECTGETEEEKGGREESGVPSGGRLSSARDAERSRRASPCGPDLRCFGERPAPSTSQDQSPDRSGRTAGHAPPADAMVREPGDAVVQAAGPRVVAAAIKSFRDIPEELFNSLQESSVDPAPGEEPPAPKQDRLNPTLRPPPTPTPAPRCDWKTMREGRRALLAGAGGVGAEDTASDVDTDTAASTSDYHTSDGRGSSLSGASDDHHRHDTAQRHGDDHANGPTYITQDGIHEDFEARSGVIVTPAQSLLRDDFRGFCSTMLGSSSSPPAAVSSPRASPESEGKPPTSPTRLEEELRAAGVYFRRPGTSPPRLGRPRGLPSGARVSGGEAAAVAAALQELEASLAGQSGSSGESSPSRTQLDAAARDASTSTAPALLSQRPTALPPRPRTSLLARAPVAVPGVDSFEGGAPTGRRLRERPPATPKAAAMRVGGAETPTHEGGLESLNLIEEVYVDTAPPASSVFMRAFYPGIHYTPTGAPRTAAKPPPPARRSSLNPNAALGRRTLDASPLAPADSDSGHESGATSPCGTLTGDDTQSPPPSPPNALKTASEHPSRTLRSIITPPAPTIPAPAHARSHSLLSCRGADVLEGEVGVAVVGEPRDVAVSGTGGGVLEPRPPAHFVVVAIDFGTTYSGYAFSFTRDTDSVHMMKKWEGGDPGVQNQKTPTIVLLNPEGRFHSLGFTARDTYHDLDPKEAKRWLYFDRFKMALHADQTLSRETMLEAANGKKVPALQIFSHALRYFRDHALRELSDQAGVTVLEEDVRWVITVPAIWSHPAKQFMRMAAYQAGLGSSSRPEQLLIALEPEAAAIYCRRLRRHQLLPDRPPDLRSSRQSPSPRDTHTLATMSGNASSPVPAMPELDRDTVYAVVDCGGGTVDITVHQMTDRLTGHLKELHKASGGPYGSTGVDEEFVHLLETIFGADFVDAFRRQRPAAFVDLMIAFESRKRNASPFRENPLNIALPFSFIDLFRKFRGKDVEWAIKKHHHLGVRWSAQGMLRVEQETMRQLFLPTLAHITQAIESVLSAPEVGPLQYMFLVGGFAESELLQKHIRDVFGHRVNVIIPQGMGLAILRGAVQFGLDPGVVTVRRSRLTYGVGVLNRFQAGVHPPEKRVVAAGCEWCADVLDRFVVVDESVAVGDVVVRSYTPATPAQATVILHLYATERHDAKFVTEEGVRRVGTLHLDLGPPPIRPQPLPSSSSAEDEDDVDNDMENDLPPRREITVHMKFGDTEVKASAVDLLTGQCVKANIDFL